MHKHKEVNNVNNILSMCDVKIFLTFTSPDKISQQPENCENRNDPDLVQAFLKKWWVESDFKAPNLPLSLRFKGSGCHCNSILRTEAPFTLNHGIFLLFSI
jgi:hypothetical protein